MTERMSVAAYKKLLAKTKPKAPKFRNTPNQVGDEKYRSIKERKRHDALKLLEKLGQITDLKREVPFIISPACRLYGKVSIARKYNADFTYYKNGIYIVEDTKSPATRKDKYYILKRHLMKVVHNIEILET